jgi:hypothetical protein
MNHDWNGNSKELNLKILLRRLDDLKPADLNDQEKIKPWLQFT